MQITISNRQRYKTVKLGEMRALALKLSEAVCQNLRLRPTKQISRAAIARIREKATLSLVLISNAGIHKLNRQYRFKDAETDVLSFTLNLTEPLDGMDWELGEIFISVEQAQLQAKALGHSLTREIAFLFVHGMLHVLGFDHEREKEAKAMFKRQKEILHRAGYLRR